MTDPQNPAATSWTEPNESANSAKVPTQPAGSPIEIKRFPDGLSICIPPAGPWNGSKGLFFFGLLWNGFLLVVTPFVLASLLGGAKHEEGLWVMGLVVAIFWVVGIGLVAAAINMGRRQAALAVAGGTLMAMQTGLLGTRQQEWELADVSDICIGPTGLTVNDEPVMELQIHDQGGGKFGFLAGRSDQELAWLCDELRRALNVGRHKG